MVRAANRNGGWSEPARLGFSILPPYWRTWWFFILCAVAVGSVATAVYRYRVGQIVKMERMRTRIAADLHDDIASSLASMAIYSDVIGKQLPGTMGETAELLGRIRELSREVTENIGLIVWAVDPRKDQLSEVFHYFQRHARQLCAAAAVEFRSEGFETLKQHALPPDRRRTIFLILKEALNNTLRHSGCSSVQLSCSYRDGMLDLTLRDDGRGFDPGSIHEGHGLSNIRARAQAIGATVNVESAPGEGTTLALSLRMA
jgi:signal transduction histidine kinase